MLYSGVGKAGVPGAGAPVKFYWSEVEDCACTAARKLCCVAKIAVYVSLPSPFTRALPVFSRVHANFYYSVHETLRCM